MPWTPPVRRRRLRWIRNRQGVYEPHHVVSYTDGGRERRRQLKLDWRGDLQRLDECYWRCESGLDGRQTAAKAERHTWLEIVTLWRRDLRVQSRLAPGTKRSYRREMDALLQRNAQKPMRSLTRSDLRAVHDALSVTPRKADWRIQMVSLLWNYARHRCDWPLGDNPAAGWDLYGTQRPFEPWPEWMIERLADAPAMVRTAAELILGKGERPSAAIETRWDDFRGEWMTIRDQKTDTVIEVFADDTLTAYLATVPQTGAHVLARSLTQPHSYTTIERAFRSWRATLGDAARPYVLHGLRKLSIIRLAESGATDAEIQAITNQSLPTIAYYRRQADRRKMSRNAMQRKNRA